MTETDIPLRDIYVFKQVIIIFFSIVPHGKQLVVAILIELIVMHRHVYHIATHPHTAGFSAAAVVHEPAIVNFHILTVSEVKVGAYHII